MFALMTSSMFASMFVPKALLNQVHTCFLKIAFVHDIGMHACVYLLVIKLCIDDENCCLPWCA